MKPFDWMKSHPEEAAIFNAAMADPTRRILPGILRGYDFSGFHTVVDVGGGDGTVLASVLLAGLHGILYDLPTSAELAMSTLSSAGVADRCQIVLGDFFEAVPPGGDAYLLKSIIHDCALLTGYGFEVSAVVEDLGGGYGIIEARPLAG